MFKTPKLFHNAPLGKPAGEVGSPGMITTLSSLTCKAVAAALFSINSDVVADVAPVPLT